ncbi:hypothetical protein [Hallella sp.]|uniref:hypothetical protein n=1 Tax=Hallella sp. TaxID=2980186 RepID=UPI00284FED33|nr:hypothetical protein [Hallella sp.]MDR3844288.1 hypothetical protein [Hallella sp.]
MANQQRFYLKRRKGTNASKIKALNYCQAPIFFLNLQCDFLRKKKEQASENKHWENGEWRNPKGESTTHDVATRHPK